MNKAMQISKGIASPKRVGSPRPGSPTFLENKNPAIDERKQTINRRINCVIRTRLK